MRRFHLFELNDQAWCPPVVRQLLTDYLATLLSIARIHAPVASLLAGALRRQPEAAIVDLCSGSGGALPRLKPLIEAELGAPIDVVLTDRFPCRDAIEAIEEIGDPGLRYLAEPVDALAVPERLRGMRTLFESLHHFRPAEARRILQEAVNRRIAIAAVEITERSPRGVLAILISPFVVLALTPWIRPRRWWRPVLTYLVPVAPAVALWDGLVSCLRTYDVAELEAMVASLERAGGYTWNIGRTSVRGVPLTWIVGTPGD